jgi:hypothetical protein
VKLQGDITTLDAVSAAPFDESLSASHKWIEGRPLIMLDINALQPIDYTGTLTVSVTTAGGTHKTLSLPLSSYVYAPAPTK